MSFSYSDECRAKKLLSMLPLFRAVVKFCTLFMHKHHMSVNFFYSASPETHFKTDCRLIPSATGFFCNSMLLVAHLHLVFNVLIIYDHIDI